jgi:cytochrome c peroxidase
LRNIEFSYPYMHDGRFKKLSQVLNHYTNEILKNKTLANELQQPIFLTSNEKVDVIAFLLTLSDRSFIFNNNYSYPKHIFSAKSNN